jgi:hypothetical protein
MNTVSDEQLIGMSMKKAYPERLADVVIVSTCVPTAFRLSVSVTDFVVFDRTSNALKTHPAT